MDLRVGATIPVYCTALGKVLLASISETERLKIISGLQLIPCGPNSIVLKSRLAAELSRINLHGVTTSDEEFALGSRSIAALVRRSTSTYPVAIDVTAPSSAYTVDKLVKDVGPPLKRTAKLISGE
jgi:IclR family pca regulon transcriptional regulator